MVGNQIYCTWKVSLWLLWDGLFQRHVSNQVMAFAVAGGREEERRWREEEGGRKKEKREGKEGRVKGKGGIICVKESLNTRQSLSLQPSERIESGQFP